MGSMARHGRSRRRSPPLKRLDVPHPQDSRPHCSHPGLALTSRRHEPDRHRAQSAARMWACRDRVQGGVGLVSRPKHVGDLAMGAQPSGAGAPHAGRCSLRRLDGRYLAKRVRACPPRATSAFASMQNPLLPVNVARQPGEPGVRPSTWLFGLARIAGSGNAGAREVEQCKRVLLPA
jgi:hypothetical protein